MRFSTSKIWVAIIRQIDEHRIFLWNINGKKRKETKKELQITHFGYFLSTKTKKNQQ